MRLLSSRWVKAGISLGLLTLLVGVTDLGALTRQVLTARVEIFLLAFVGYLAGQVLSVYRWQLLARPFGFAQPLRAFAVYYFVGMYLNLFAPSIVLGDLGRGLLLAEGRRDIGPAFSSVLADRVSGVVMLLWVSAGGFLLFGPTVLPALLCYGTIAAAALTAIGWWALPHVVARCGSPRHKWRRVVEKIIVPYRARTLLLTHVCVLALAFHFFQLGLLMLLAYALGFAVPFWYLMLFTPLVTIVSVLPLSFSGIGVRESGYVVCLALIGVGRDQALALGLLWSAIVLGAGLVGGVVLLLSPEARLSLKRRQ
ncbi:MAG: lysylphosphatidylglycerol synthase transmembrane domain-containing protein [Candidatus Binatia bacterium]